MVILIIIFTILIVVLCIFFYLDIRNIKVNLLRRKFLLETDKYDYLPSYEFMLFSIKPITLEYWSKWIYKNY